jgi:hypothetical protein
LCLGFLGDAATAVAAAAAAGNSKTRVGFKGRIGGGGVKNSGGGGGGDPVVLFLAERDWRSKAAENGLFHYCR